MSDEAEITLAPEAATDISPEPEFPAEIGPEIGDDGDEEAESQDEADDSVGYDFNGKTIRIPKAIADQLADIETTKKNIVRDGHVKWQEAAELRKQATAEREQATQHRRLYQEMSRDFATIEWIDERLQALQGVPFNDLSDTQKLNYINEQQRLATERTNRGMKIEGRKSELAIQQRQTMEQQRQTMEQHLNQAVAELQKPDPKMGWLGKFDQTVSSDLTAFGLDIGFTQEEMQNTNHPTMIKLLHLAKLGKASLKARETTPARPLQAPAAKVTSGRSQNTTDPSKQSIEQIQASLKKLGILK